MNIYNQKWVEWNDNEDSTTNLLYSEDVENMICKDIDEITIKNSTTQHKQKLEQLEIEYLLCNTSTNAYITEITKNNNWWKITNIKKIMKHMT